MVEDASSWTINHREHELPIVPTRVLHCLPRAKCSRALRGIPGYNCLERVNPFITISDQSPRRLWYTLIYPRGPVHSNRLIPALADTLIKQLGTRLADNPTVTVNTMNTFESLTFTSIVQICHVGVSCTCREILWLSKTRNGFFQVSLQGVYI